MYIVDLKYLITVTVELKLKLDISIFELVIGGAKLEMIVLFMGYRKIQIQYKLKHNTQMINDTL